MAGLDRQVTTAGGTWNRRDARNGAVGTMRNRAIGAAGTGARGSMQKFTVLTGVAAPLLRANVDTDAIIPSREMKTVSKSGLADGLFAGWRYAGIGSRQPNPDFVLNQPAYAGAQVLLAGENFGCGSSREHAVWALAEYGIRAVIAPSFAPIFRGNCVRNGVLPVTLDAASIARLADSMAADPQHLRVTVDLHRQRVAGPREFAFELDTESREMLLAGLDAIDLTLKHRAAIGSFHARDRAQRPWIYLQ
jgi:3-isopropylmalate/(R)-2-methylmalate dehydratase small subunit